MKCNWIIFHSSTDDLSRPTSGPQYRGWESLIYLNKWFLHWNWNKWSLYWSKCFFFFLTAGLTWNHNKKKQFTPTEKDEFGQKTGTKMTKVSFCTRSQRAGVRRVKEREREGGGGGAGGRGVPLLSVGLMLISIFKPVIIIHYWLAVLANSCLMLFSAGGHGRLSRPSVTAVCHRVETDWQTESEAAPLGRKQVNI